MNLDPHSCTIYKNECKIDLDQYVNPKIIKLLKENIEETPNFDLDKGFLEMTLKVQFIKGKK